MPLIPLRFKPGINRDVTSYTNEGGWYECDKVRFRQGFPEKIGGWTKYSVNSFLGTCRNLFNWVTSYADNLLGVGTEVKLYIEAGGVFNDITPVRASFTTTDTDNCIATTSGSTTVTVSLTSHGCTTGAYVIFSGATTVGGIPVSELNAEHAVTVINANTFTFTVTTAATSTVAAGGGTGINIDCLLNSGASTTTYGYGWGTSFWGRSTWGSGSSVPLVDYARYWWYDNFDNDLVICYNDGFIGKPYYWARGTLADPLTSLTTRAVPLSSLAGASDTPTEVGQLLVSQNDKHLLAFGATPYGGGTFDPLLIRWANQDEPENWTPQVTNSAGFIRISRGSIIKRALATRQEILVWTDTGLHSLQFTGTTDVFSLQELSNNISLMGPRAVATSNGIVFWMGHDKFYAYTGRVETLPCPLMKHLFDDFNHTLHEHVVSGTNEGYNEVWWFYPSAGGSDNDSYIVYNYVEKIWYYGSLTRTAWIDSGLREFPQGVYNNRLYNHESGLDADGSPLEAYIESADFDLEDGESFMLTRRIIPDINFGGSTASTPEVDIEFKARQFPGTGLVSEGTERVVRTTATTYTPQVHMRARGRAATLKISSDTAGVQWQLGVPRLDARKDGRR